MTRPPRLFAVIVAAGVGSRVGGALPKQYQVIAGKPVLAYAMEALTSHPAIAGVQVVIHPEHEVLYAAAGGRGEGVASRQSPVASREGVS